MDFFFQYDQDNNQNSQSINDNKEHQIIERVALQLDKMLPGLRFRFDYSKLSGIILSYFLL